MINNFILIELHGIAVLILKSETAAEATSGIKREIVEEKQSVLEVPSCEFDCDFLIKLQEVSLGN